MSDEHVACLVFGYTSALNLWPLTFESNFRLWWPHQRARMHGLVWTETREGSHCVAGWRHERPIHLRLLYLLASLDLWPLPCLPWWFFAAVGAGPGELGQAAASRTAWLKLETHARGWEREHTGRFNGSEGGSVVDREGVWGSGGDVRWGECCWGGERFWRIGKDGENGITKKKGLNEGWTLCGKEVCNWPQG